MKIIADPNIPFVREAFSALGEIQFVPGRQINASVVRDADTLLVRSVTPVNGALLDGSRVKFVATATIGTDHIDQEYLRARGIGFASAEGSNTNSVAEYVVIAILEIARRNRFHLRDKTLGVVGVGNVGRRVVHCAEALGIRVLQNDPPRERAEGSRHFVPLERAYAEADIITLHVPLTKTGQDATHHLFDGTKLAALERRPLLMNTARGAVVDNHALLKAIDAKSINGVVLDVWEGEPNISTELLNRVDIGTPHIAGYSFDGKVNGTLMIYRAACEFWKIKQTWDPGPLMPAPAVPSIELTAGAGDDDEDVLRRAITQIYDITADDRALRKRPKEFDRLRAEYPVRREFFNTELTLHGANEGLRRKFAALGFKPA